MVDFSGLNGLCSFHDEKRPIVALDMTSYGIMVCKQGQECRPAEQANEQMMLTFLRSTATGAGAGACGGTVAAVGTGTSNSMNLLPEPILPGPVATASLQASSWDASAIGEAASHGSSDGGFGSSDGGWAPSWGGCSPSPNPLSMARDPTIPAYAECASHGKKRSGDSMMWSAEGTLVCKPGFECKVGVVAGISDYGEKVLCKFYMTERGCNKGDECQFSHDSDAYDISGMMKLAMWKGKGKSKAPVRTPPPVAAPVDDTPSAIDGICSIHNKHRTGNNLTYSEDGSLVCKPGFSCKTYGSPPDLCAFWLQGNCVKGNRCDFSHGEDDSQQSVPRNTAAFMQKVNSRVDTAALVSITDPSAWIQETIKCSVHGKPRSKSSLVITADGTAVCAPGMECHVGADTNDPCIYFQRGVCNKGDQCRFRHEGVIEGELADSQPASGKGTGYGTGYDSGYDSGYGSGKGKGKGKAYGKRKGKFEEEEGADEMGVCSIHNKMRTMNNLDGIDGYLVCKPGLECRAGFETKVAICDFYMQGACTKGALCKFAHGEHQLGDPVPDPTIIAWIKEDTCAVHGKKRGAQYLMLSEDGNMVCKPGFECKGGTENLDEEAKASTPCRFFALGTCQKGDECPWSHEMTEMQRDLVAKSMWGKGSYKNDSKGYKTGSKGKSKGKSEMRWAYVPY